MRLNELFARNPLTIALLFQGSLIPFALVLALFIGLSPGDDMQVNSEVLLTSMLSTAPPLVLAWWLSRRSFAWVRRLLDKVHPLIDMLFQGSGQGAIIVISLLAGFGEELLFRGVVQAGIVPYLGTGAALVIASLFFGLVHAITPAYFVLATIMGLYLGFLYHQTDNLLIPCLVHALYDWVAIVWYLHHRDPPSGSRHRDRTTG